MRGLNERPVCHRAEDLVTFLYGEASEAEAQDFRTHLRECAACSSEFAIFNQVHESIVHWRNEALGLSFEASRVQAADNSNQFGRPERKLSALAAVREFFSVSPVWLRAAAAFAVLLLCVMTGLTLRLWQRPNAVAEQASAPKNTDADFQKAVQRGVADKLAELKRQESTSVGQSDVSPKQSAVSKKNERQRAPQFAANRSQPRYPRFKGLTRQEREQLAADLRLVPTDDEEQPFGLPEEPNQ